MTSSNNSPTNAGTANHERRYRLLLLVSMCLIVILLLHLTATTSLSRFQLIRTSPSVLCRKQHLSNGAAGTAAMIQNETRLRQITQDNRNLVYLHPPVNIVLMTMAKAGTSTTWHWLYPGVTGKSKWDIRGCATYVHDIRSSCWKSYASYLYQLPIKKQWDLLTSSSSHPSNSATNSSSNGTTTSDPNRPLRVAIQRNPFERIISSFKSKFTCEHERFGTDVHNRRTMVPILRRRCQVPNPPANSEFADCMNITEFASALEQCRLRKNFDLELLDVHIKPQQFFFDEIDYDMIIDVNDLSDINVLRPIIDRIPEPNRQLVVNGPRIRHSSGLDQLNIPEAAAHLLYSYALESVPGKLKYIKGAEPAKSDN